MTDRNITRVKEQIRVGKNAPKAEKKPVAPNKSKPTKEKE